ncbi:ATP-binding protein [Desulfocurvus sp. DL9XJH121]
MNGPRLDLERQQSKQNFLTVGMSIPAFFLLLLVFQLFFMPSLVRRGGQLYVPFKKIVVGGRSDNPPYEYLDENNEPAGFNVDLTRALAAEMKSEVEIRLGGKREIQDSFNKGEINLLQGVPQSDELAEKNIFCSYTTYNQKLFSVADYPKRITSLAQIPGGELYISKDAPLLEKLVQAYPRITFHPVGSHTEALRMLADRIADYALIVNLPSIYLNHELAFIEQGTDQPKILQIGELSPPLGYGYVAGKGNQVLETHINESLNNLRSSGRLREIREQWLGRPDPVQVSKREKSAKLGGMIFSPLMLIICSVIFWNHSLQKEMERRSRKLAIQQMQLIQADKMTSLGILVAGVAHEINNPIGLILYNLATLKRVHETTEAILEERYEKEGDFFIGGLPYSSLREETPQIFTEMNDGAKHIAQIVEDLKDFTRQHSTALDESVDLNAVVLTSLRLLDSSLKKRVSGVDLELAESLPVLRGNGSHLQQVVINLVLNAAQANAGDDRPVGVRTFFDDKAREVVLQVRDQGVGIEPGQIPFLCDPFYTTRREQGGTGLGLSISERIVKEHDGRLHFASRPGAGTCVSLYLPVIPQKERA